MSDKQIFTQVLPAKTAELTGLFHQKQPSFLKKFYLSGGTALSLQFGHRESEDLDFFSQDSFDIQKIQQELIDFGNIEDTELAEGAVNTFLNGVKVQFLEYPYDLVRPTVTWRFMRLSSVEDIACTKLQTIGMRGSKKDFVDIYFVLKHYSLSELLELIQEKYQRVDYSKTHILKSLVYFEDAEKQPMPRMHKDIGWNEVKEKMIEVVRSVKFK